MVFTRSAGGSASRAAAMVTKTRSNGCAFGMPLVGTFGSGAAVRRLQRRPQEGEIDALMRAGLALHRHADRGRRHVEGDARDRDRQRGRIRPERRARPARPEHMQDEAGGGGDRHADDEQRQRQQAAMLLALARRVSVVNVARAHPAKSLSKPANQSRSIKHDGR